MSEIVSRIGVSHQSFVTLVVYKGIGLEGKFFIPFAAFEMDFIIPLLLARMSRVADIGHIILAHTHGQSFDQGQVFTCFFFAAFTEWNMDTTGVMTQNLFFRRRNKDAQQYQSKTKVCDGAARERQFSFQSDPDITGIGNDGIYSTYNSQPDGSKETKSVFFIIYIAKGQDQCGYNC